MAITQVTVASPASEIIFQDTAMGGTADGIKASSAVVYYVQVDNTLNGAASYVKLYNLASGSVTVGTTVPDQVLLVAANKVQTYVFSTAASSGMTFGTALSAACTTAGGTAGNTSPSSSVVVTVVYV
jgi:hypothetical protein